MARREDKLIAQIEAEALDSNTSVAGALRKCIVLGGKSGSESLRDWAAREMQGYYGEDPLPEYRVVAAQIQIDGATMQGLVTGQPIAWSSLPDFVQEKVQEQVELREGAGALEELVVRAEPAGEAVKFSLPMGGSIARLMTSETQGQQIPSICWALAPAAVRGVLDQIRTALTLLVAELRASLPNDKAIPSATVADQAVNFVVTGERHKINVTTLQVEGESASATVGTSGEGEAFWTYSRKVGAFVVGTATIVGAVAAVVAIL